MIEEPATLPVDDALLILDFTREVTSSLDLQEVLDRSLSVLRRLISFGGGSIQLLDRDGLALIASDPPAPQVAYELRVPPGQGVGGRIVETCAPIYISDIFADPRVPPPAERALSPSVRSYFGVPLIMKGRPIGVVQIDSPDVDGFSPRARGMVLAVAPAIAAAVQNAQLYAREVAAIEELRATQRVKADFLAMISHEFRTPLTTLCGFSELLSERADSLSSPLIADIGRRMWRASRWLSRMIGDLLDLSQIERGTLVLDVAPTDIERVVRDVTTVGVHDARPIEATIEPDLPTVWADPERLKQVLGNLLSNARKFSPPESQIDIDARRCGDRVDVSVHDRGRGIREAEFDRIFDAFVQIDSVSTREAGGLGTGLLLVRELCDRMGAEVRVQSQEGLGSRFVVSLRVAGELAAAGVQPIARNR